MSENSRRTKIYVHAALQTVKDHFCEIVESKTLNIFDHTGSLYYSNDYLEGKRDKAIIDLATRLDYRYEIITTQEKRNWWVKIDGRSYDGEQVSKRKCAIVVETDQDHFDKAYHYERVDKVIAELAKAGFRLLEGQCEVTVTTRC